MCMKTNLNVKNPEKNSSKSHPFYNANIVFTGKLQTMTRAEASKKVMRFGGHCKNSVTKNTHYLILGTQVRPNNYEIFLSTKMVKAEVLINEGIPIKIMSEDAFLRLI